MKGSTPRAKRKKTFPVVKPQKLKKRDLSLPETMAGFIEGRALWVGCRMFHDKPDQRPPDDFVKALMLWFLRNYKFEKLTNLDLAAMADAQAPYFPTNDRAFEYLAYLLAGQYDKDAIRKAHERYGKKTTLQIQKERNSASASPVLPDEMQSSVRRFAREMRKWEKYFDFKRKVFGH